MGIGNRIALGLLGSPVHRILSGAVMGLEFEGRRSGHAVRLPVQYAGDRDRLVVCASNPASKTWWRNFERPRPATVTLAGRRVAMVGTAVQYPVPDDPDVATYRERYPKVADIPLLVVFTPADAPAPSA